MGNWPALLWHADALSMAWHPNLRTTWVIRWLPQVAQRPTRWAGVGSGESECSVCARGESRSDVESMCCVWTVGLSVQFEFRFLHLAVILIGALLLRRSTNGHSQLTHSQRRDARTQSHPYHSHHTPHKSTASHAAQRPTALCVGGSSPAPRRLHCTCKRKHLDPRWTTRGGPSCR